MSTLTITTIQSNLHWENKAANLQMFEEKIRQLQRTEVVILPEMFSTGFSMQAEKLAEKMDGTTIAWMKKLSAEKKIILTGSLIIEEEGNYYNRLVWMLPNGQYGYYDKRHLFAYAQEDKHYTPGNKRLIASVKGWKINLLVCYDLRFPVWSRQKPAASSLADLVASEMEAHDLPMAPPEEVGSSVTDLTPEFDVLVYVANWPERRNHAWKTLLQARAIENQCYVVGVNRVGNDGTGLNYSGDSMIVDALGTVVYTKANEEDIFTITLQKEALEEVRNKLPFLKDADRFIIA
ncbi:nitrilase family protein [Niastella caeni]|uniref:Nitrilase family protein n=1 Tax=Niastella caeni TaxID=2569763 RepID=A0A4S8I1V9_9BACT|nr:nitrilase family protein [Niastella caeni]THU41945.1 nitrilase family protein [Niastella caeni]